MSREIKFFNQAFPWMNNDNFKHSNVAWIYFLRKIISIIIINAFCLKIVLHKLTY